MSVDKNAEFVNSLVSKVENFEEVQERKTIGPYNIKDEALFYRKEDKEGGYTDVFVSRNTPYVKKKLIDMENGQIYYTIRFKDNNKYIERDIRASGLAQKSELIKLADSGLGVTDINARHLIGFIDYYIKEHDPVVEKVASRVGYINNQFVLPGATDIRVVTSGGLNEIVNSFKESGTLESYQEEVFSIIKGNSSAMFFLLTSLASPLLKHFDIDPFIVDLHGKTSQGKTTLLRLASSAWGTGNLVGEWNITKVALERKAAFLNNLPLLLDDTRKASPYVLKDAVYQFSGGKSKGRGNVNGIDEEITYKNIMLSTGEIALTEYNSEMAGIAARVIGISEVNIKKDEFKPLYEGMKNNHGVIGNAFIKHFSNDTKFYKQMMDVLEGRYYDKARGDDILTRIGRSFAVVHLAGLILNEINGFEFDVENVLEDIYTPIADGSNTTYNKPKQLMIEFLEMLDSKRRNIKYDAHDDDKFADTMAIFKHDGLYIPVAVIKEYLEKESNSIRKQWLEENYTHKYSTGDTNPTKFDKSSIRCIKIPRDIYSKLGFDFDKEFS